MRSFAAVFPVLLSLSVSIYPSDAFVSRPFGFRPPQARFGLNSASNSEKDSDDAFLVGVLGDLHLDPRKMDDYGEGRKHFRSIFEKCGHDNKALVSLGDLGESKAVWEDSTELFSGTTACHTLAADYLSSFGVPYELVGGNHDLEGIDEFATDQENLDMFLQVHNKPSPQFIRRIADKTLLVGLTSTVFRDAKFTSHEVTIDDEQLRWFETMLRQHPASNGWKIFVFTHAPPAGSGLRVLEENHVVNGCCWLNQSNEQVCPRFLELVREHRCVKAWFSAHFHLGQDYHDSITFPNVGEEDGNDPDRGSCVFCQTSVMRSGTSRDGCQQSRLIRGNKEGFQICTVDHKKGGRVRVDASVTFHGDQDEVGVYNDDDEEDNHVGENTEEELPAETFVQVYTPTLDEEEETEHLPEEGFIEYDDCMVMDEDVSKDTTAWFELADGRVLGTVKGMLIEYEPSTLAPLGLVVGADELLGKRVAVLDTSEYTDSAAAADGEQAVVLIDEEDGNVVVVQPNEDGSYWRKIVRNKMVRMQEVRREKAAKAFAKDYFADEQEEVQVISSWGPYTTTSGTAKGTGQYAPPNSTVVVTPTDDEKTEVKSYGTIGVVATNTTSLLTVK